MSTINATKTLKHSPDGANLSTDGLAFDGTNAWNASVYSEPFRGPNVDAFSMQVSCLATGTPNGSFALQASNDVPANDLTPDGNLKNWSTISFWDEATGAWAQSKAVAGAQSYMVTVPGFSPRWFRFAWTNTNGAANLIVRVQTKGDGGR